MFGYNGLILRIDLSETHIGNEKLDEGLCRKYLGGSGFATRILYDEIRPKIDPLNVANKLIVATGPLAGTAAPSSGAYVVASKSPLTGIWGEAVSIGFFGAELKKAGYDVIIIEGRADRPVWIYIKDEDVEIRSAAALWGKDVYQTTDAICKEIPKARVACIGPGGENLIRFAAIISDKYRAAGRTGMGAIMGSKNLKAIAVEGTHWPEIADPATFKEISKQIRDMIRNHPSAESRRAYGTSGGLEADSEVFGNVPTRYFKEGVFENAEKISGEFMAQTILKKRKACFNCPIGCGRHVEVHCGPYAGTVGESLEYETIGSFGSLCFNDNLESLAKANDLCNRFGVDTITTGNVIAFAIECFERGWISEKDGFNLKWGDHSGIVAMIPKICKREGFGKTLAEGVKRAAGRIGKKAEELAMHVKGLEIPMHDPRSQKALGLIYATAPRGAVHKPFTGYVELYGRSFPELSIDAKNYDRHSTNGKAYLAKTLQDLQAVLDSLGICYFAYPPSIDTISIRQIARLVSSATGYDFDANEFLKIGERIFNHQRLFNLREGLSRSDDTLPRRFLKEFHSTGPSKGQTVNLKPMLDCYYELRGWNPKGIPKRAKLKELELPVFG